MARKTKCLLAVATGAVVLCLLIIAAIFNIKAKQDKLAELRQAGTEIVPASPFISPKSPDDTVDSSQDRTPSWDLWDYPPGWQRPPDSTETPLPEDIEDWPGKEDLDEYGNPLPPFEFPEPSPIPLYQNETTLIENEVLQ